MSALRIVFFGTPEIAVPTLEALIAGPHEVVGVVSQPDRRRGRGKKLSPSPVSKVAIREGLPLLRPDRVGDADSIAALADLEPDVGVVLAFGQFLPKPVRELPSCGYLINAHASLLPKYRGASPIAQAILDGEEETGISVMRVEREMDAGPVALVERTRIGERENTAELSLRLAALAATAISKALDLIARDAIEWTAQDAALATVAPKIEKEDAPLDLEQDAHTLARRIHALAPRPGATLRLLIDEDGGPKEEVLKILRADVQPSATGAAPTPGAIELDAGSDAGTGVPLRIATGDGWLVPLSLQRAGGKPLAVADFLRGYALGAGAHFKLGGGSTPPDADPSSPVAPSEPPAAPSTSPAAPSTSPAAPSTSPAAAPKSETR